MEDANMFLREFKNSRAWLAVFIVFIAATGAVETYRYFSFWASNPNTAAAFNEKYVEIGHYLNSLPADENRFVIVNARDVLVPHTNPEGSQEYLPMSFEPVLFETLGYPQATLSPCPRSRNLRVPPA